MPKTTKKVCVSCSHTHCRALRAAYHGEMIIRCMASVQYGSRDECLTNSTSQCEMYMTALVPTVIHTVRASVTPAKAVCKGANCGSRSLQVSCDPQGKTSQLCKHPECSRQASYGKLGTTDRDFCYSHKLKGMKDNKNKQCIQEGCEKRASFNYAGMPPMNHPRIYELLDCWE